MTPEQLHKQIQQQERAADWAWAMFFAQFLEFEVLSAYNRTFKNTAHFHLTATKRGKTTKGIEI